MEQLPKRFPMIHFIWDKNRKLLKSLRYKFDIQLEKEMTWLWDRRMIASGQEKGRWNSIEFVVVSYKNENSACTVKFLFKKVRADCRTVSKILVKNILLFSKQVLENWRRLFYSVCFDSPELIWYVSFGITTIKCLNLRTFVCFLPLYNLYYIAFHTADINI